MLRAEEETSAPGGMGAEREEGNGCRGEGVAWKVAQRELVEVEDIEEDKREKERAIIQSAEGSNCHREVAPGWRRRR